MKRLITIIAMALVLTGNAYGKAFDYNVTAEKVRFESYAATECAKLMPDWLAGDENYKTAFKITCELAAMGAICERFDSILALPYQAAAERALKPTGSKAFDAVVKYGHFTGKMAARKYVGYGKE